MNEIPIPAPGYQLFFGLSLNKTKFLPCSIENFNNSSVEWELSPKITEFLDNLVIIVLYSSASYSAEWSESLINRSTGSSIFFNDSIESP